MRFLFPRIVCVMVAGLANWVDSAYVFVGGLPFELTEGDVITVFSQ